MIPTIRPKMPYTELSTSDSVLDFIRDYLLHVPWKALTQRVPGVIIIFLFPFAIFGPIYMPIFFAFYFIFLHILFVANNFRSAYGVYTAYTQSRMYSTTDWYAKYCHETGVIDGSDTRHDMPFDQVSHIIILPNYKEEMDTLCETLDVLASHRRALTQ